jgi:Ca-activated chloride channel family protein
MFLYFSHPWFLLLLPVAPLLTWWWLRRRPRSLSFPETDFLRQLPRGRGAIAQIGGASMRLFGLALLILALAGPRWPDHGSRISTEGVAIALVVDVSGSMAEKDFDWGENRISRMDAVKQVVRLFVNGGAGPGDEDLSGRTNDLICLVTFATGPDSLCPLTSSHSTLLQMLDQEQPRRIPTESETNIGDAIAWALVKLDAAGDAKKAMLLFTDGEHNVPPPAWKPSQAAQVAASLKVPIYTIDVGGKPSSLESSNAKAADLKNVEGTAEESLRSIAALTGGRYFRGDNAGMLLTACQDIDRLERSEFQSFQYRRFYEAYAWFGLAALVLFVSTYVLENSLWLRVP